MSAHAERENIIVVGGGIIGCTCAYYLTRHSRFDASRHSIIIIEAAKIANGASGKAGGLLASWALPSNIAALSFDLHAQLATEHGGEQLWGYRRVHCGQLTAVAKLPVENFRSESETKVDGWDPSRSNIQLGKWWKRERDLGTESILPHDLDWFKIESVRSYEEFADTSSTAQVNPQQFTTNIVRLAEQAGARIVLGTVEYISCCNRDGASMDARPLAAHTNWSQEKVASVTYTDKVTLKQHTIPAATIVLAAGPWTPTLMPKLRMSPVRAHGISIKVKRPVSAYCLFTEITLRDDSQTSLLTKSKIFSAEIYSRPNNEVYICSQGDTSARLPSPAETVAVSAQSCQEIIDAVASVSDELREGYVTGRRACFLPTIQVGVSNDPLVGHTGLEGLLLATGHSCWGILNAPITGKMISEIIFDNETRCVPAGTLEPRNRLF